MKKITITGSRGAVGTILMNNLIGKYELKGIGLPEINLADYEKQRKN